MTNIEMPQDARQVRFAIPESESSYWWDVRARGERYVVLTHQWPFHPKGELMYSVADLEQGVRGAINLIGGGYGDGTYSDAECLAMLGGLEHPEPHAEPLEVSHRNVVKLDIREAR
jgi:hypothetical protein